MNKLIKKVTNIQKKYLIVFILVIGVLTSGLIFTPLLTLKQTLFKTTPEPQKTNYLNNSYFKLIDYNPINPKAFLINQAPDELIKKNHIVYLVFYTRIGITEFKIEKELEIVVRNKTFQQLKDIFSSDSPLKNNPDPENIAIPCIPNYCTPPARLSDSDYRKNQDATFVNKTYFGVENKSDKTRTLETFKQFKKGTIMQNIRAIVGPADVAGIDDLNYTKSWEALYDIDGTPGVNMVILSLEGLADNNDDFNLEKLIKIYYANDKNEVFELKTDN